MSAAGVGLHFFGYVLLLLWLTQRPLFPTLERRPLWPRGCSPPCFFARSPPALVAATSRRFRRPRRQYCARMKRWIQPGAQRCAATAPQFSPRSFRGRSRTRAAVEGGDSVNATCHPLIRFVYRRSGVCGSHSIPIHVTFFLAIDFVRAIL